MTGPQRPNPDPPASWLERFLSLSRSLGEESPGGPLAEGRLGEMWQLLFLGLQTSVRRQARRFPRVTEQDIRDIAAEKTLEMFRGYDCPGWGLAEMTAPQLSSFLRAIARNGVIDFLRRRSREVSPHKAFPGLEEESPGPILFRSTPPAGPEVTLGGEFSEALRFCLSRLSHRFRTILFLRVFCELPTKLTARHPGVRIPQGSVDVYLGRARHQLRACLATKGFQPADLPEGSFLVVWEMLQEEWTKFSNHLAKEE